MLLILRRELIYLWYYFSLQLSQIFRYWVLGMVLGSAISVFAKEGNFLSHRMYTDDGIVNGSCLEWLERTANAKVHGTTKLVPAQVFQEEREFLRPLPVSDQVKRPMICRTVRKDNTIIYDSNRYSIPLPGCPGP